HHQRGLSLPGMVEGVVGEYLRRHQRVHLNPVERVRTRRMLGIIIGRLLVAPPAFAALPLDEAKDRLPASQLERQVGWHAGREILGLVMDDGMDVAEAYPQQAEEQCLGERRELAAIDLYRAVAFRRLDRIARRAVIKGRQDDELHLLLDQLEH